MVTSIALKRNKVKFQRVLTLRETNKQMQFHQINLRKVNQSRQKSKMRQLKKKYNLQT